MGDKKPTKRLGKTLSISINADVHKRLETLSEKKKISRSSVVEIALRGLLTFAESHKGWVPESCEMFPTDEELARTKERAKFAEESRQRLDDLKKAK